MNKILKILNKILIVILLIIMFYQFVFHFSSMSLSKILTTASIIPIIVIPYLIDKIFHYRMKEGLLFIYYGFIVIALGLGSILNFYTRIAWFDLLAHFIAGIVASITSWIVLERLGLFERKRLVLIVLLMITFALSISCLWEFFEFFSDIVFGGDTQWVKETGVNDTMEDMLIAFLGSMVSSGYIYLKVKNDEQFIQKLTKII